MSSYEDRQLPPLIRALLNADAYDHPVDAIELEETHISWVLLTGPYAYKVKKPINLGFVDFSTLELRRQYCQEEIRLNRRFAPGIYVEALAIEGTIESPKFVRNTTTPIEYAVKMVQFSCEDELDQLIERGELTCDQIETFARSIAAFHESIDVAGGHSPYGKADQVIQPVEENFKQIRQRVTDLHSLGLLEQVEDWSREQFQLLKPIFENREADGFIRECHGDLHLANMAWVDNQPLVFDCIEFNPSLRWIDVMSEIAFLTMDLEEQGSSELAYRFLNAYLELSGDYEGLSVLRFYLVYRLLVRAKVEAIQAYQQTKDSEEKSNAEEAFGAYLRLAVKHTQEKEPRLIITCGLSGSGKSSVTRTLLGSLQAIRIRSDVERKRLFGLAAEKDGGSGPVLDLYRKEATDQTYDRLATLARIGLERGFTIIVDATCLKAEQRKRFQQLAASKRAPYSILNVTASESVLRNRLANRQTGVSDADAAVLEKQMSAIESFSEGEIPHIVEVNSESRIVSEKLVSAIESSSFPTKRNHRDLL